MKTIAKIAAVAAIALGTVSVAQAQTYSASPQIPTFANPAPLNPVATDGSPLPYSYVPAEPQRVYTGRSVGYGPVGALVGAPVGFAADTAGAAIGTAGNVVDGTVGTVVR